ncbi:hypothetical protein [uncultured Clostridium sp.]|uniref:hypothetical protein n=1 Tax=uncultured Clostridium sp. TaxID=59620 RepID=UPI0025D4021A|nr:hypothetical protein [uncultured Clostridium sp.]
MSQEKEKFNLSKLKDISSMEVKDIGKIFKKNNNGSNNIRYKDINNKESKIKGRGRQV